MDIQQTNNDRSKELDAFKKEYVDLKVQYQQSLTQAVYETDPAKQADEIRKVLDVNAQLAQHVRTFIQSSQQKFNPDMISKLTADIIHYQQEYESIKKAEDKNKVLSDTLNQKRNILDALHHQFNLYLGLFLSLIVIILMLIFRTSLVQLTQSLTPQVSSTSMSGSVLSGAGWFDVT